VSAYLSLLHGETPIGCADVNYAEWKDWAPGSFGRYDRIEAAYFAAEVPIPPHAQARILELGFGNGAFLAWARDQGADVYGVEMNPLLVERGRQLLGEQRAFGTLDASELDARRETFSHIVAFDVLEHIPQDEYPALFGRLVALLAPGGRCIVRFPNGDSPFSRAIQHGDPTHVTTLGSAKLVYFAQRAGLKVKAVRAPALPTANVGWRRSLRRRLVLGLRFVIESIIGRAYFGRRVPLDLNCTVVLARE
jgi:2-polyprenyl-3-methyl-5-hydroxy-6-metoxy-1,4-benzoquinol methylase